MGARHVQAHQRDRVVWLLLNRLLYAAIATKTESSHNAPALTAIMKYSSCRYRSRDPFTDPEKMTALFLKGPDAGKAVIRLKKNTFYCIRPNPPRSTVNPVEILQPDKVRIYSGKFQNRGHNSSYLIGLPFFSHLRADLRYFPDGSKPPILLICKSSGTLKTLSRKRVPGSAAECRYGLWLSCTISR